MWIFPTTRRTHGLARGLKAPAIVAASLALCVGSLFAGSISAPSAFAAGTTYYVAASGGNDGGSCTSAGSPCATIQSAVTRASDGDTISIAAGTYRENVTVTHALTIGGAGQGSTIVEPGVSNPNCGGGGGGSLCAGASNVFLVRSSNVTIHDLTVNGDNPNLTSGITAGGADLDARNGIIDDNQAGPVFNNFVVYNTTVENIYLRGIYASTGGSFNFHDNTVTNVQADPSSIAMFNYGGTGVFQNNTVSHANDAISSNHSRGTQFIDNTITNSGSGVHSDNNGDSGGTADLIQGNTISNCTTDGYGIFSLVPYLGQTITGNSVIGCAVGLAVFGGNGSPAPSVTFTNNTLDGTGALVSSSNSSDGILVTTDQIGFSCGNVAATFTGNSIADFAYGVQIVNGTSPGCDTSGATVDPSTSFHHNSITGSAVYGMDNEQSTHVSATQNWWGCAAGPNNAGCDPVNDLTLVDASNPLTSVPPAGGSSTLNVTTGTLSIAGATPGNFTAVLRGSDQFVYSTLGSFTVQDATGTGNGWRVTMQASQFTGSSHTLALNSLMIGVPTVAPANGTAGTGSSAPPSINIHAATAIDSGGSVSLASAAVNSGMGTYTFTPATLSCPGGATCGTLSSGKMQLFVPSSAFATTYSSTITVSAISGP